MAYLWLKSIHLSCVALTISGFLLRGYWMLVESPQLQARWVRVLPHAVDSLLLASAIGLTLVIGQYPFSHAWLTAKLAGLLIYILLGAIALRRGRSRAIRSWALGGALCAFGYIAWVAVSHQPWPAAGG